jgi:hypothetical protein
MFLAIFPDNLYVLIFSLFCLFVLYLINLTILVKVGVLVTDLLIKIYIYFLFPTRAIYAHMNMYIGHF